MADPGKDQTPGCTANRVTPTSTVLQQRTGGTERAKHPRVFSHSRTTDPFLQSLCPGNPSFCSPRTGNGDGSRAAPCRELTTELWALLTHRLLCGQSGTTRMVTTWPSAAATAFLPRLLGAMYHATYPTARASTIPRTPQQGPVFLKSNCPLESSDPPKAPCLPSTLVPNPLHLPQEKQHSMDKQASADGSHNLLHRGYRLPFASHSSKAFERIVSFRSYSAVVFTVTLKHLASSWSKALARTCMSRSRKCQSTPMKASSRRHIP